MTASLQEAAVTCPWCWERITLLVDLSGGDQAYVEDCSVCCNPMDVVCSTDGDSLLDLQALRNA